MFRNCSHLAVESKTIKPGAGRPFMMLTGAIDEISVKIVDARRIVGKDLVGVVR